MARIAGAYAAVLVDGDGEAVDYAGTGDPFDLKVAAAHIRILIYELAAARPSSLGAFEDLNVRGTRSSFLARALPDGYALVVLLRPRATLFVSSRALEASTWGLSREAGWPVRVPDWLPVEVDCDTPTSETASAPSRARPLRVQSRIANAAPHAIEVLGTVSGLPGREQGYRVRLANGVEATLIRETGDRWYADIDLEGSSELAADGALTAVSAQKAIERVSRDVRESAQTHRARAETRKSVAPASAGSAASGTTKETTAEPSSTSSSRRELLASPSNGPVTTPRSRARVSSVPPPTRDRPAKSSKKTE